MFYISSNDLFFSQNILNVFLQKNLSVTGDKEQVFFANLFYQIRPSEIEIQFNQNKKILSKPCRFETIFSHTIQLLSSYEVNVGRIVYLPIKQSMRLDTKINFLNDIHNIIFSSLTLYCDAGIERRILYHKIWPKDKEVQFNKLDTHLTNLKSKLKDELNYDCKIVTQAGKIKLIIN